MSIQPVFLMSDIFPFSAILDFLRDILMQAWLCLAVVLRPIVGDTIVDAFPFIMGGTLVTVGSVALALGMGLVLGVPMAVLQVYGNALARRLVGLYVWFFRGVPILVLLFLSQGLFLSMGWIIDPFSPASSWAASARPISPRSSGAPSRAFPRDSSRPHAPWACAT